MRFPPKRPNEPSIFQPENLLREKGADNGSRDALWVFERVANLWRNTRGDGLSA